MFSWSSFFWTGILSVVIVNVILAFRKTKAGVEVRFTQSAVRSDKISVHIPGYGGDGYVQVQNANVALVDRGHLLTVHNDGKYGRHTNAYDINDAVREIYDAVLYHSRKHGIKIVELYGSSMGGKVAYMVKPYLEAQGFTCNIVFIDSPPSWKYLQPFQRFGLVPIFLGLPYLPFFCLLMLPPFDHLAARISFPAPNEKTLSSNITPNQRAVLANSVLMARRAKATYLRDQVKALARKPSNPGSRWTKDGVVFIRSDNDGDVVLPTARKGWEELLKIDTIHHVILKGVGHCFYGGRPASYQKGFRLAQAYLDRRRT